MKTKLTVTLFIIQFFLYLVTFVQAQENRGVIRKTGEKRLALVIGNADYQNTTKLNNTVNDANDMAAELRGLGFEVIIGTNQNKRQMETLIRQFGEKLAERKGVGLFYYSGHGVQSGNKNYLIPVDADIPAEDEIGYQSVDLGMILGKLNSADNDVNIVILDACRSNPFAKRWRKVRTLDGENGLASITKAPTGTLIAYATQPDEVASDGTERNGLYTAELLKQIRREDLSINQIFQNTRSEVLKKSNYKQVPWELSSLLRDLYLSGDNNPVASHQMQAGNQSPKLTIDTPSNRASVGILTNVIGSTPYPNLKHYVVVYSLQANRLYIQQPVSVEPDGKWSGTAAFGTEKYGVGDQWSIRIFATASSFEVGEIPRLPADAKESNEIIVNRVR